METNAKKKQEELLVTLRKRRKRVEVYEKNHPDSSVPMLFTDEGWIECGSIDKLTDPTSTSLHSIRRGTFFGLYPQGNGSRSLKQQQKMVRDKRDKAISETEMFQEKYSMAEQFDIAREARVLQRAGKGGEQAHLMTADDRGCRNPYARGWCDFIDDRRHHIQMKREEKAARFEKIIKTQAKDGGNPRAMHQKQAELRRMLRDPTFRRNKLEESSKLFL
jgi:hypothetical protein